MTHVVRISNKKRGWTVFQVMGTLGGAFFVFMGCMLMINLLKDPHNGYWLQKFADMLEECK